MGYNYSEAGEGAEYRDGVEPRFPHAIDLGDNRFLRILGHPGHCVPLGCTSFEEQQPTRRELMNQHLLRLGKHRAVIGHVHVNNVVGTFLDVFVGVMEVAVEDANLWVVTEALLEQRPLGSVALEALKDVACLHYTIWGGESGEDIKAEAVKDPVLCHSAQRPLRSDDGSKDVPEICPVLVRRTDFLFCHLWKNTISGEPSMSAPVKQRILVTGAAGFVGSHLCAHILEHTTHDLVAVDKLGRGGFGLKRLRALGILHDERLSFWAHDLATVIPEGILDEWGPIDVIFHLAAESHVDQSILFPSFCISNNVMSTVNILEAARTLAPRLRSFVYWGTDEVHGPSPEGVAFKESHAHNPSSPYAASKSASEQVANAYRVTYGIPVIGVNCMNIIGEGQACEKALPRFVRKILRGEELGLHTYPGQDAYGTRGYIYVREVVTAALFVEERGAVGESYNIGGQAELDNLQLAKLCADELQHAFTYRRVDHDSNRPGHDLAYRLDSSKLSALGWEPSSRQLLEEHIRATVRWYQSHPEWLLLGDDEGEVTTTTTTATTD